MSTPLTVTFDSVTKRFGAVVANDTVSCEVAAGSFHAFLGENGAGKSTLMKILSGCYQPDSGRILLSRSPVVFRSPSDARDAGIGMVYQHFTLIPSMTVLDNILLGDPRVSPLLRRRSLGERVESEAKRLGFHFDLSAPVWRLGVSERQKVEIFKLLWRDAHVLILDEPTSQLAPFEAEDVLTIMSNLAKDGRTILMVSHNIEEVLRFSSHISVLRRGRCVATVDSRSVRVQELAGMMVGALQTQVSRSPRAQSTSVPVLSLKDVTVRSASDRRPLTDITLDIYSGEILGVAGVAGSGQDELAAILTGHLRPDRGTLLLKGKAHSWETLQDLTTSAAHVPADPRNDGSVQRLSLLDNLFLRDIHHSRFHQGPFLRMTAMQDEAKARLDRFQVQPDDPDLPCSALSGGNLQRLILARELASQSSLLVAVNPTAGLDLAAARTIQEELRDYASEGNAVVFISHDLPELLVTCDRILVLCAGEVVGIEPAAKLDSESLGLLMGGVKAEIVHVLTAPQVNIYTAGNTAIRTVLLQFLDSPNWWQRRLAAQIGLRVFGPEDLPKLRARFEGEDHDETKVWLSLALARVGNEVHLEDLVSVFDQNPDGFVDAQRQLLRSEDYTSVKSAIQARLLNGSAPWESVLGLLVLKHLGVILDGALAKVLKTSNCATVARLASKSLAEEGRGGLQ
jgi:simple sugar transport system ATP-binding protein